MSRANEVRIENLESEIGELKQSLHTLRVANGQRELENKKLALRMDRLGEKRPRGRPKSNEKKKTEKEMQVNEATNPIKEAGDKMEIALEREK